MAKPRLDALDQDVQRVGVLHPRQKTRIRSERDDGVALDPQMALEGLRVLGEKGVAEPEELHDTLVLPQIFVSLEQEAKVLAVAALDRPLSRPLLRDDDLAGRRELGDPDERLADLVRSRDGELHIARIEKWRRDGLHVEHVRLGEGSADPPEDDIVEIPSLVEIADFSTLAIPLAADASFHELLAVRLDEVDLADGLGALHVDASACKSSGMAREAAPSQASHEAARGSQTWPRCCDRRRTVETLLRALRTTSRARGWPHERAPD